MFLEIKSVKEFMETPLDKIALETEIKLANGNLKYELQDISAHTVGFLESRTHYGKEFEKAYDELLKFVKQFKKLGVDINKEPESENEKVLIRLTELNYAIAW
nr:MAG TPA: hypothetical protein [Caudoviricetes sp.]